MGIDHLTAMDIAHANRPLAVKQDPVDPRPRHQFDIAAFQRRLQIGVRRRPAPPLPDGHIRRAETFLPVAVIIRGGDITGLTCRIDKRRMQGIVALAAGHMQRPAGAAIAFLAAVARFHAAEIRQHISIAPALRAAFLPMGVVTGIAADKDHAVDRRRAADDLATGADQPPPAKAFFRLGEIPPVIGFHVHGIGQRRRHLDERPGIAAAKLKHQHPRFAIFRQTVGQCRARRTRSDDDIIPVPLHLVLPSR